MKGHFPKKLVEPLIQTHVQITFIRIIKEEKNTTISTIDVAVVKKYTILFYVYCHILVLFMKQTVKIIAIRTKGPLQMMVERNNEGINGF